MNIKKARMKENTALEIYLVQEGGGELLGDYTFPANTRLLYVDGKVIGRLCDIMSAEQLIEWGYDGQEMWLAEIDENDFIAE